MKVDHLLFHDELRIDEVVIQVLEIVAIPQLEVFGIAVRNQDALKVVIVEGIFERSFVAANVFKKGFGFLW